MNPDGPAQHAQRLWRENLWLRDILTRAAEELERLATDPARGAPDRERLQRRAQRMRQRLFEGPPEGWTATRLGGMATGD